MEKVVKCGKCNKYFGHTEKNNKCPFCKTEYGAVEEKKPEEKSKEKKVIVKIQKGSFKIWKDN